jgi:ferredoxin
MRDKKEVDEFYKFLKTKSILKIIIKNLFGKKTEFLETNKRTEKPHLGNCIGCGLCVDVCPTNAIEIFKFREIICSCCGVCVEVCPNNAIEKDRFTIDTEKCTKCGYCVLFCSIPYIKNEIPKPKTPVITSECNKCMLCIKKCENKAILFKDNKIIIDEEKCKNCLKCVEFCPMKAILSPDEFVNSCIVKVDINSCIFCKECVEACPLKK